MAKGKSGRSCDSVTVRQRQLVAVELRLTDACPQSGGSPEREQPDQARHQGPSSCLGPELQAASFSRAAQSCRRAVSVKLLQCSRRGQPELAGGLTRANCEQQCLTKSRQCLCAVVWCGDIDGCLQRLVAQQSPMNLLSIAVIIYFTSLQLQGQSACPMMLSLYVTYMPNLWYLFMLFA